MTISYNWLSEYLPLRPSPEELSRILTSIGLEVEGVEKFESVKGSLAGLIIGEIVSCSPHPGADKLKLTAVHTGEKENLEIVCGAPNVAAGQKVVVAPVGSTIFPTHGEPIQIKRAKIRGIESQGMICAEDEIGLGESHAGILVLPSEYEAGKPVAEYLKPYADYVIEIGLTPNHMDAMSHLGVARDVCAYLSHHEKRVLKPILPSLDGFAIDNNKIPITVSIEDPVGCERFSGISIEGIEIAPSPAWMQDKLRAIGLRPINNIVDITNFVLHETGQPLHAYDADKISGHQVIVRRMKAGSAFVTLDGKKRTLSAEDLMICNAEEGMCIAGVFGGLESGVQEHTKNIFLESAWFNPLMIRKTSFLHGLRTDAAIHFEKGMDISNTVNALKRAATLIKTLAKGKIASDIVDIYPAPRPRKQILTKFSYLKKISGKEYKAEAVKNILSGLEFELAKEEVESITVSVPYHKPDIALPADIAEEIMRIDGYDQIEIPASIRISPSIETNPQLAAHKEKIAVWLVGAGFSEIFTNSITNSAYYSEKELESAISMINNLSSELNIMRPSLLETGLESVSYNLNRKNGDLRFFEFGKSYHLHGLGKYVEKNHLSLYVTGNTSIDSWKAKSVPADFFYLKGICNAIFQLLNVGPMVFRFIDDRKLGKTWSGEMNGLQVLAAGRVDQALLRRFDIRQPVYFADINWDGLEESLSHQKIEFSELAKQLPVFRDLALVVDQSVPYEQVRDAIEGLKLDKLEGIQLFDIFESEKLGPGRKSMAINLTFVDEQKTMTDKEIDLMMGEIIRQLEQRLNAEIRR